MSPAAMTVLEAQASPSGTDSFYRPGLDILRVLAFLLVFVAHGLIWSVDEATQTGAIARTGEFGVCIFFFLSSYLITELLRREKRDTGTILIPAFYARRILRIWPLYFAIIAVSWLYGLVSPAQTVSPGWALSLLLLLTNWYTVDHGYPPGFLFPLWSIAIEEQFYLLWPWMMKYVGPYGLLGVSGSLMAAAYVTLAILLHQRQSLDPGIWVNSLVEFQFFALGTMVAIGLRGRTPRFSPMLRWVLFAAGLLCLRGAQASVYRNDPSLPHDFAHIAPRYVLAMLGCLGLFFSLLQASRGKLQRPLIYLGKISYGLYVYHIAVLGLCRHGMERLGLGGLPRLSFQLSEMALALPATIATAMLSYRYLESPFLRLKKRFTLVSSRPV